MRKIAKVKASKEYIFLKITFYYTGQEIEIRESFA